MARVALDATQRVVEPGDQLDVLTDQPLQHRLELADQLVQIDHPRLDDLLAAERQKLLGERRRVLARPANLLDMGPDGVLIGQLVENQLAVAVDGGEQVVEVVGNTACQPADGLHLLHLTELFLALLQRLLGSPTLGDVANDPYYPANLALLAPQRLVGLVGDQGQVLGQLVRQIRGPLQLARHGSPHHPVDTDSRQVRKDLPRRSILSQDLFPGDAGQSLHRLVPRQETKFPIEDQHAFGHRLDDAGVELAGGVQALFGPFPLDGQRNVTSDGPEELQIPFREGSLVLIVLHRQNADGALRSSQRDAHPGG